jgi:hypothetical protein
VSAHDAAHETPIVFRISMIPPKVSRSALIAY